MLKLIENKVIGLRLQKDVIDDLNFIYDYLKGEHYKTTLSGVIVYAICFTASEILKRKGKK